MKNSWMRSAGVVFAVAAVGVVVNAGLASAADATLRTPSAYADWVENGDTLTVCDPAADGLGVRGYIYRPSASDPANGTVLIKASDPSNDGNCVSVSKDIDESIAISIKVCNYQGDVVNRCAYKRIR